MDFHSSDHITKGLLCFPKLSPEFKEIYDQAEIKKKKLAESS